jgi:hypothetical protein
VPYLRGYKNYKDKYFLEPRNYKRVVKFKLEVTLKDAKIKDANSRGYTTKPKLNSYLEPRVTLVY